MVSGQGHVKSSVRLLIWVMVSSMGISFGGWLFLLKGASKRECRDPPRNMKGLVMSEAP